VVEAQKIIYRKENIKMKRPWQFESFLINEKDKEIGLRLLCTAFPDKTSEFLSELMQYVLYLENELKTK